MSETYETELDSLIQEVEMGALKTIEQMISMLESAKQDATKSDSGHKASGISVRKVLREIRVIAKAEGRAMLERNNSNNA